ncbi:flavoprotein [Hysterangium stoloniferum]|nr:flavoprotein [Hysterangium stoloniferum]
MEETPSRKPATRPKFPARSLDDSTKHVLILTTGSVASLKLPLIVKELLKYKNVQVQVASTKPSLAFFPKAEVEEENEGVYVWTDEDEWSSWNQRGDPILHIELRRWTDIILVAPCSANTLSKLANGACDNLVTSVLRATTAITPVYVFPAMNTHMYLSPLTETHLSVVTMTLGYTVVGPIGKNLACGDVGTGAMTEWLEIVQIVVDKFKLTRKDQ